ncbi:Ank3 [Symbiodinium natans]|uniref:Ank3 protein n=1 Tax=Symbiodinium natans TaxID=878477 RepID=A0A812P5V3_9DINO|nr:Ank3 [Symbiodinium natans]
MSDGVRPALILICGPSGSGKSTLAKRLGDELQAAVIHQDDYFLKPFLRYRDRAALASQAESTPSGSQTVQSVCPPCPTPPLPPHQSKVDDAYEGPANVDWPRLQQDACLDACLARERETTTGGLLKTQLGP